MKKGKELTKSEVESIIKNYGTINNGTTLITTQGEYEINLNDIIGWKQAK